jgi:hypothetical protein
VDGFAFPVVRRHCRFCDWFYEDAGPPPVSFDYTMPSMASTALRVYLHREVVERILSDHIAQHVDEMCEP